MAAKDPPQLPRMNLAFSRKAICRWIRKLRRHSPTMSRSVWYAVYGSNLSRARFRLYLEGEQQGGRQYSPCAAGTSIRGDQPFPIGRELFSATRSEAWGAGGVAIVD